MSETSLQAALPRAPRSTTTPADEMRANAIAWASRIAGDPTVVFLDTETTGLGPDAEICDIGIVALDGTVLLDCLVRPSRPIPAEATAVHGITDEMVQDAMTWQSGVADLVSDICAGRTVVIYNAAYDTKILDQVHRANGGTFPFVLTSECAMLAFSDFRGELGRFGTPKWHKLDVAAAHFAIPPGGHRALADAETARRVVLAMAATETEDTSQ